MSDVWQEHLDPGSKQYYYYNVVTGVSAWVRPPELGTAFWQRLCGGEGDGSEFPSMGSVSMLVDM